MGNFRYKIAQFMMGRNGIDSFCNGLLAFYFVAVFADILVPGSLLSKLGFLAGVYAVYRMFSKNIARRQAENKWYVETIGLPLRSYINRDRKNYSYFKCPTCKQVLRAPKGRGKIRVTCSRCGNKFERKV